MYPFVEVEYPKKNALECPWIKCIPILFVNMNITNRTKHFKGDMKTSWNKMCFGQGLERGLKSKDFEIQDDS